MPVNVSISSSSQIQVSQAVANPVGVPGSAGQSVSIKGQWTTSTNYVYRDIVYNNGVSYICKQAHASASLTEPGVGANWTNVYEPYAATPINDGAQGSSTTYSSDKIETELASKSDSSHTHSANDILSDTLHPSLITSTAITQYQTSIDHNQLLNFDISEHRTIDDASSGATDLWSAQKIVSSLGSKADVSHTHGVGDITVAGTFDESLISQISITQHQAAIDHGSIAGLGDNDHTTYINNSIVSSMFADPASDFDVPAQNSIEGENNGQGLLKLTRSATTTTLPTKTAVEMFTMYDGATLIGGWIDSNGARIGSGDHTNLLPNDIYWYWDRVFNIGPNGSIFIEDAGSIRFYEQATQGDYYLSIRAPEDLSALYDYILPKKATSVGALLTHAIDGADNGKMRWEDTIGTAFPTTNLYDGRKFMRKDLGEEFFYDDGTIMGSPIVPRWISTETVPYFFGRNAGIGAAGVQTLSGIGNGGPLDADTGFYIPHDMLILDIMAQSGQSMTGDYRLQRDSTEIGALTMTASQSAAKARSLATAIVFSSDAVLWADVDLVSGVLDDPQLIVWTKKFISA